jgi:hypothetical protein
MADRELPDDERSVARNTSANPTEAIPATPTCTKLRRLSPSQYRPERPPALIRNIGSPQGTHQPTLMITHVLTRNHLAGNLNRSCSGDDQEGCAELSANEAKMCR